jgi:hypothetical protein
MSDPSGEPVAVTLPNAGEIGTKLSIVNSKLQDLAMCGLPPQQLTLLNGYYSHKRNKLQLQLGILARNEKIGSNVPRRRVRSAERHNLVMSVAGPDFVRSGHFMGQRHKKFRFIERNLDYYATLWRRGNTVTPR